MPQPDAPCACGAPPEVVRVDVVESRRCPACDATDERRASYDLLRGEMPPDLSPLGTRARRKLSTVETVALASPATGTAPAVEAPAPAPGSSIGWLEAGAPAPADPTPALGDDPDAGLLPPNTALGVYRLQGALGRGGMGVVYAAYDTSLDRRVAIKVLNAELCRNAQFIERFEREAKACAALSHPNITHIYAIDKARHYFVMELVAGDNLADRVARDGPLAPPLALDVVRQTARGLRAGAAIGIIHRDIKPSNLLIDAQGQVKITDFGLAKAFVDRNPGLTSTGIVMGTPLFMSPEQGRGGPIDQRSDIYSLGASLYYVLYGRPPFEGDSPIAIILKHINDAVLFPERDAVPEPVRALLLRMLEKDVSRRIPDYDALLADLDRVERGEGLSAAAPRRVVVVAPRSQTRRRSLFKVGKLSVARTNLKLGRRDKAKSLLEEAVGDVDAATRNEAAVLLCELFEGEGDVEGVRRMAQTILQDPQDPALAAFAAWKLADLDERAALESLRQAVARYEAILRDPPDELPRAVVEAQLKRLRGQLSRAEREVGATQVVLGSRGA